MRNIVADFITFSLMLTVLLIFLAVKATIFVISTFLKYYKHIALWIALLVSVLLCVSGSLLVAFVNHAYELLIFAGIAVLLITCKAVDIVNRDTFMIENSGLTEQVLKRSWWSSEDEPVEELAA